MGTSIVFGDPSPRASRYPTGVRDGVGGRILSIATTPDGGPALRATGRAAAQASGASVMVVVPSS